MNLRSDVANRILEATKLVKHGVKDGQPRPFGQFGRPLSLDEITAECIAAADDIIAMVQRETS